MTFMSSGSGAVPRIYDDFDDEDTRLDPAALIGGLPGHGAYRGGTALMPAAMMPMPMPMPTLQGPAARFVAANTPGSVQIRVSPQPRSHASAKPASFEWGVAVAAGLLAAVGIGALAALL